MQRSRYGPHSHRNARKTHCDKGHAFDAKNTRIDPQGWRECRACDSISQKRRRMNGYKAKRNMKREFAYYIRYKYGLSVADYDAILERQNDRCAICKQEKDEHLHVDHDHVNGKVRGLLCRCCNTAIGHLKDSEDYLLSALRYLGYDNFTMDSDVQAQIDKLNAALPAQG